MPSGRPGLAKAVIPALARGTVPASGFTEAGVPDVGTSGDTNLLPLNERRASIALDHREDARREPVVPALLAQDDARTVDHLAAVLG